MAEMQIAILAGGLGTRLGKLAETCPKSMLLFRGRPFLEHQLRSLTRSGVRDIVLCTGHLGEQIQEYFGNGQRFSVTLRYSIEEKPLGTAGALKRAGEMLHDVFFTLYGDSYLFPDYASIWRYFSAQNKLSLMTVYQNPEFDKNNRNNTAVRDNLVTGYSKTAPTADMCYLDYGVSVFRKSVLDTVPGGQFYSLENLSPGLIASGEMLAYEVKERYYEVGSREGIAEFARYADEHEL